MDSGNLIMKTFQNEMKQRFRIAPTIVDRFKDDIWFMENTNLTYVEVVELRETFLEPLGYELSDDVAIGYIYLLLNFKNGKASYRFGTYEDITQ